MNIIMARCAVVRILDTFNERPYECAFSVHWYIRLTERQKALTQAYRARSVHFWEIVERGLRVGDAFLQNLTTAHEIILGNNPALHSVEIGFDGCMGICYGFLVIAP